MGENELYWNATGLAVDSVLCGCGDLECIEKRQAADEAMGLAADHSVLLDDETFVPEYVYCQVCGETDDSRVIHNHPERHEFHMADQHIAFCICGWVDDLRDYARPVQVDYLGERYREHLDRSS